MNQRLKWILGIIVGLVLLLGLGWVAFSRMNVAPTLSTTDGLDGIPVGANVNVIGQIVDVQGQDLTIEAIDGDQLTGIRLIGERTADTTIQGGTAADVKKDSVAEFSGNKARVNVMTINQIVLTKDLNPKKADPGN